MARASKYAEHRMAVLAMVEQCHKRHGKAPTVRDLADWCDVGVATMHSYLQKLAEEEMIQWQPGRHRSLQCTPAGIRELSVSVAP